MDNNVPVFQTEDFSVERMNEEWGKFYYYAIILPRLVNAKNMVDPVVNKEKFESCRIFSEKIADVYVSQDALPLATTKVMYLSIRPGDILSFGDYIGYQFTAGEDFDPELSRFGDTSDLRLKSPISGIVVDLRWFLYHPEHRHLVVDYVSYEDAILDGLLDAEDPSIFERDIFAPCSAQIRIDEGAEENRWDFWLQGTQTPQFFWEEVAVTSRP